MVIILLFAGFTLSCKKEKAEKPVVTLTGLGHNNTSVAYLGADLHIEAEIVADGKIDNILLEIYKEGARQLTYKINIMDGAWQFDSVYTDKYSGALNTTFFEDLPIPLDVEVGFYHLHLRVADEEGNQASAEDEFRLEYGK